MSLGLRPIAWLAIAGTLATGSLRAQTVIYATDFPDAQGWTLDPGLCPSCVHWNVDATPASVLGAPAWRSPPYSLNYNDVTCYGAGGCVGITFGAATSPVIDIGGAAGTVTLAFWCLWDTELDGGCFYDRRKVQVSNDGFQTLLLDICFYEPTCGPPGYWHSHGLALQESWGAIQVRFDFHTGDGTLNSGAGWFVDDLDITQSCTASATYCTPKVNSQGCTPVIFTSGTPSLSGQGTGFRVRATSVLNQHVGIMIWGSAAASTPFGGGILCIAPPLKRTPVQSSNGSSPPAVDCSGTYSFQFTSALMGQAGLQAGQDVYSQYWSRDSGYAPPNNVGLTGGVHWVVCP